MKNMKEEKKLIFNTEEKMLQGKWIHSKTLTDFNKSLGTLKECKELKDMPKYLFFGEGNIGTDLKDVFSYNNFDHNQLFRFYKDLNNKNDEDKGRDFFYYLVNQETLALYEKPEDEKFTEETKFFIYKKLGNNTYTSEEIQYLCEKYSPIIGAKYKKFNKDYIGKYKINDIILENEVENYNGKIRTKDACFVLQPLFSILDIQENKDVYVMEDDDELYLRTNIGLERFDRQNSKMTISMCSTDKADFYINNFNGQKHRGKYKKVGDEEFMFVDLDCSPDVNEKIHVFKKLYR